MSSLFGEINDSIKDQDDMISDVFRRGQREAV